MSILVKVQSIRPHPSNNTRRIRAGEREAESAESRKRQGTAAEQFSPLIAINTIVPVSVVTGAIMTNYLTSKKDSEYSKSSVVGIKWTIWFPRVG